MGGFGSIYIVALGGHFWSIMKKKEEEEVKKSGIDLRAGNDQNILPIHPNPLFRDEHLHPHSRDFSTLAYGIVPHSIMFTHDLSGESD
jgi:hypothetical protein